MEALGQEGWLLQEDPARSEQAGGSLIPLLIPDPSACAQAAPWCFSQIPRENTGTDQLGFSS